jgi:hypothetical protein
MTAMFKFYNVHRTNANRLQALLNDHAERGWEIHHIRNVGSTAAEHLMVIFVRTFGSMDDRDGYLADRAARHAAAKKPAVTGPPEPALV